MSAVASTQEQGRKLGRFVLLRELGQGAQATVWLAHDPRLEREVALKLLDPQADADALDQWLHEARAVSRLTHPNIVPVFEADVGAGHVAEQPYLVFEYVDGPTLSQQRRKQALWPAREAVQLMLGVLDALAAAHSQGIVHRDLKPSNVLLGSDGRARVMDFGIAARVANGRAGKQGDGRIVGTPGYMSPEAARGEAPQPAMDVFAAGVMLGELLAGMPLLRETDPWKAVERVQREDLKLPADARVDDTLRGIVQRAIARDARQRYDGARSMHAALSAWLAPAAAPAPSASHGTLEFLLRRMRHKTDFPALSDAVLRIQRVAASETANLGSLTDEILKDVALTNKLLRMVNSVHFAAVAGGNITTISRAVSLVGFAGIRNMALAVLLLEHMGDKGHASTLKEEFVRALMAGTLAAELTPNARDSEEAFLGSMFQNLGRLLTEFYFPEEAVQIRQRLDTNGATATARESASMEVLGIGFDELGTGVAEAWGLPAELRRAMSAPLDDDAPQRALPRGVDRLRWLGRAANGLTDALLAQRDTDAKASGKGEGGGKPDALLEVAARYAAALDLPASQIAAAAQTARGRLTQLTSALGLQLPKDGRARRLIASPDSMAGIAAATATAAAAAGPAAADEKTAVVAAPPAVGTGESGAGHGESMLERALDDAARALADRSLRLNELLNLVLDTMHRALGFRGVVLCLREPKSGQLLGRFAIGELSARAFRIEPANGRAGADLFAALAAKGADTLIADASAIASKLPAWYRKDIGAASFLLLPLMVKGAPIGLIYADKIEANSIRLSERERSLLRGLRDKLVEAFARGVN